MTFRNRRGALRASAILASVALSAGCLSSQVIPAKDRISGIRTIDVVAMEPPPLDVSGESIGAADVAFLPGGYGPGAGALVAIAGVVALMNHAGSSRDARARLENYRAAISDNDAWSPTMRLAGAAAVMLRSGYGFEASTRPGVEEIPGIDDRASTLLMENWLAPIRAWYNADPSPRRDPGSPGAAPDAILEVGVLNYEIHQGNFMLSICLKLVEPETGAVIGRARRFAMVPVGNAADLFSDGASRFQETFSASGDALLKDSLDAIALNGERRRIP